MKNIKTGKDSVVIGNVSGEVGDGSVVIGPTDAFGNTRITQPMAVGRGASAGAGSIAIGAGASAGSDVFQLINLLKAVPEIQSDEAVLKTIEALQSELSKPEPNKSMINGLWTAISGLSSIGGAAALIQQIGKALIGS